MAYIQGVNYKGLDENVTSTIYHMTRNIECIHRQKVHKHHAYIMQPPTHGTLGQVLYELMQKRNDNPTILSI
jgi:hypothetical protein